MHARLLATLVPSLAALAPLTAADTPPEPAIEVTPEPVPLLDDARDPIVITATRSSQPPSAITTTTILDHDLDTAPQLNLPDIIGREAGVQVRNFFGGPGAARASVDLRGFGATATQNSLVLVNGQRLNSIDLAAVDFSSVPVGAVDRIEIIRGNSAGVLYGDGAVGGAINIVTRRQQPTGFGGGGRVQLGADGLVSSRVEATVGTDVSSASISANALHSDGYRDNNEHDQVNLWFDYHHKVGAGEVFLTATADDQSLGLPGGRIVDPSTNTDLLSTDRRGTSTPDNESNRSGQSIALGTVQAIAEDWELIVDGSWRRKDQDSVFDYGVGRTLNTSQLTTWALTPRLVGTSAFGDTDIAWQTGLDIDIDDWVRDTDDTFSGTSRYAGEQTSVGVYGQGEATLGALQVSTGIRLQQIDTEVDNSTPLTATDERTEWAGHIGLSYRFDDAHQAFVRAGRSFRSPTMDERADTVAGDLQLETQTSWDAEVGYRHQASNWQLQASIYYMQVDDELFFDAYNELLFAVFWDGANRNLGDTERYGLELDLRVQPLDELELQLTYANTNAEFRDDNLDGDDVPLVADHTVALTATWAPVDALWLAGTIRYEGERTLDNVYGENATSQDPIPDFVVVDIRAGVRSGPGFASLTVANLFDEEYYNYAIASSGVGNDGRFSAYPLPGRSLVAEVGVEF